MMRSLLSSSITPPCSSPKLHTKSPYPLISVPNFSHNPQLFQSSNPRYPRLCCSTFPGSPGSGENDNKTVVDAFFLGKALGEALTERIESTVGEFLNTVGRLQAEQQKQIQDFQDDVLERAKRAKRKAAREALEEQGRVIPSSTAMNVSKTNVTSSSTVPTQGSSTTPSAPILADNSDRSFASGAYKDSNDGGDSLSSVPIDE